MARPTLRTAFLRSDRSRLSGRFGGHGSRRGYGGPVATAELAAAVSNAGGLGVIGGVAYSPDVLRAEIRKLRSLTDKPFGVDLLLAPKLSLPHTGARDERCRAANSSRRRTSRRSSASRPRSASS